MKKMCLLLVCGLAIVVSVNAQPGQSRRSVEERVKIAHDKLDSAFKLDPSKIVLVDSVFAGYYRSSDKVREELRSGDSRPDFSLVREKMQPLADSRDKELKGILTEDQFKIWKDQIEPSMRTKRGDGPRGPRGQR
jgi:periplasmic protein CpxP/Spy